MNSDVKLYEVKKDIIEKVEEELGDRLDTMEGLISNLRDSVTYMGDENLETKVKKVRTDVCNLKQN